MDENNPAEQSAINSYMKSLGLAYSQGGNVKYVNGFNKESGIRLYEFIQNKNNHSPALRMEWIALLITLYKKTLLADKYRVLNKLTSNAYKTNIIQKIALLREGIPREDIIDFLKETSALKSGPLQITDAEINQLIPE